MSELDILLNCLRGWKERLVSEDRWDQADCWAYNAIVKVLENAN